MPLTFEEVLPKRKLGKVSYPAECDFDFDAAAARFREFVIGQFKPPPKPPKKSTSKDESWAVFADPHCPHVDWDKFARAIHLTKRAGATRALVPGDLLDLFAFSRFAKYEHEPVEKEMAAAKLFLQTLSAEFEAVDVIQGNHDERARKYFASLLPPEFMFLAKWNLAELCGADLPNVSFPRMKIDGRELPFLWMRGDLVLGHPETSSKIPMRAVDNFASWFGTWERIIGVRDIRVMGQGHTHQAGGPVARADGVFIFELGCLCRLPDYAFDSKLRFRPQTNACAVFHLRDGKTTDINESQLFFL